MSVKLSTRQVGDVTVIDAAGRITLGEGTSTLRDAIRDSVGAGHKKVLESSSRMCVSRFGMFRLNSKFVEFDFSFFIKWE